jgi:hypothetical protein
MAITPWAPHPGAEDCFNRPTTIAKAATATADDTSVAFTAVDGEAVTFNEYTTRATFTENDNNTSGCIAGDPRNCHFRHAL